MGVLLLLRHGQASLGAANYDELSELGRRQARAAGDRLAGADLEIGHVVCGSLVRQRDTAQAVLAGLGRRMADLAVSDRLDEYDHIGLLATHPSGISFEAATTDEGNRAVQPALEEAIARWAAGGGGDYRERHDEFTGRVLDAVGELSERPGTTLAVTSGGVIAVACAQQLGLPLTHWPALARVLVNGSITKFVTGRSGTNLLTFNDHAHLESDRAMITYR
jgi:broad specificity phosphatase PhoE